MNKKIIVIAIGGNSLINDNKSITINNQYAAIQETVTYIVKLIEKGYKVVITHGNGPQVGFILRRSEIAAETEQMHEIPLVNCNADTQGAIGYQIQQALTNEFELKHINNKSNKLELISAVTVITQVLVEKLDKAFNNPSKPIGSFYTKQQMEKLRLIHSDWIFINDSGRGYRRIVPSPKPKKIIEIDAIKLLIDSNFCVITAGGGGIPVYRDSKTNALIGIDAVIDKDFTTSLLAREINANILIISTGVQKVCLNFGKPNQKSLGKVTINEIKKYMNENHFASGSMLPKIKAAIDFLESGDKNRKVIITSPKYIYNTIIDENFGTVITI